ncbi:MAG: hypothetical protein WD490_11090 [Opitutales bacterium]
MALQLAVDLAQGVYLFDRKSSGFRQHRPKDGGGVAFGEDKPVVVRTFGILKIEAQKLEKQDGDQFGAGHARCRMPGSCFGCGRQ